MYIVVATYVHLSVVLMPISIVSPTNPVRGWVGITEDFTMYFCQFPHSWGSFYVKPLDCDENTQYKRIYRSQISHFTGIT